MKTSVMCLGLACLLAACAGDEADTGSETGSGEEAVLGTCEGAAAEGALAEISCVEGAPVDEAGFTAEELGFTAELPEGADSRATVRQYNGPCTGIWYGCSKVVAEGWQYTVCGSALYAWMKFQGAYGNLVGWGYTFCLW
jgi:hypothetical protein